MDSISRRLFLKLVGGSTAALAIPAYVVRPINELNIYKLSPGYTLQEHKDGWFRAWLSEDDYNSSMFFKPVNGNLASDIPTVEKCLAEMLKIVVNPGHGNYAPYLNDDLFEPYGLQVEVDNRRTNYIRTSTPRPPYD